MHKTFIIGSIFNVPLRPKTAILDPLNIMFTHLQTPPARRVKKVGGNFCVTRVSLRTPSC